MRKTKLKRTTWSIVIVVLAFIALSAILRTA